MRCLFTFSKVSLFGLAFFMAGCSAGEASGDAENAQRMLGRTVLTDSGTHKAGWPGSGIEFAFEGRKATIEITDSGKGYMDLLVNDVPSILDLKPGAHEYLLVDGDAVDSFHVELTRRTESYDTGFFELGAPKIDGEFTALAPKSRKLLFLGDSITAGFGVAGTNKTCENTPKLQAPRDSYAYLAAESLDAEAHLIAISGRGVIYNWDGNPAPVMPEQLGFALPDMSEVKWDHTLFQPDAVVVLLGTNDWSVIDPGQETFRIGYRNMLSRLRQTYANAHIVTIGGPLLSGEKGAAIRDGRDWALTQLNDSNMSALDVDLADYGIIWSCNHHPGITSMKQMANTLVGHFEAALGWEGQNIPMPPVIKAPAVLPAGGEAHFGKRLEEVAAKAPINSGTILIGDSITEAWMRQRQEDFYPFSLPVRNHGVGWDVTEGAVSRLPLIDSSSPDQIFIKIGTNDISLGVPLPEMTENFDRLLSSLVEQEPQAQLYVQSVLPREADKLSRIATVNNMQAAAAKKYGAIYIDLTPVFGAEDGTLNAELTSDGLHLNDKGYSVWARELSSYVK